MGRATSMQEYWAALAPEEKKARVAHLRSAAAGRRSAAACARIGASKRASWAAGRNRPARPRTCRGCSESFAPSSGSQRYCTGECKRLSRRALAYGLSRGELQALIEEQGNVCALCGSEERGWARAAASGSLLVVDHDHDTGRVRGLLCGDCNTALGRFKDDPALLRAAAEYLESA